MLTGTHVGHAENEGGYVRVRRRQESEHQIDGGRLRDQMPDFETETEVTESDAENTG